MGHFAAFEDDADVDFVSVFDELFGFLGLGLDVVLPNGDVELDFLELGLLRVLLEFAILLLLLETVFAVVEDLADGRVGVRGDAEQVEVISGGEGVGLAGTHPPKILAFRANHHDDRVADVFVDGIETLLRTTFLFAEIADGCFPPTAEKRGRRGPVPITD